MKIFIHIIFAGCLLSFSCATYKNQYVTKDAGWKKGPDTAGKKLIHTMYLIGDAGNDAPGHPAPVLKYLKENLGNAPKSSSAIFLGDNIYEYGMPPAEDTAKRKEAAFRITSQLETLDDFKGRPVFLPGNHDWRGWGLKGLKRQEKFVENYLRSRAVHDSSDEDLKYFLPADGCSGAEVVELNDQVVLLVIDTEWWLRDWDKEPGMNDGCEVKNRDLFKFVFENTVRKYRNKTVVIAMHHPLYTYGSHGGKFTLRQHIFPLTDISPKLYVPLPGLGTLSILFRSTIGSKQDAANQHYKDLRAAILSAVKKNGHFIFASGHEHTLQYIEKDGQYMIVSGSGGKQTPVTLGKGSQFASGQLGFSTLKFYEGGETWVQYYTVDPAGTNAELVFQKQVKDKLPEPGQPSDMKFAEYDLHADSALKAVVNTPVKPVNRFHNFFFGSHHRNLYLEKYNFPVLNLDTFKGGVVPVKQGGGNQTNSLRVKDKNGRDYVLRSTTKDATRFLPFPFNKMVAAKYLVEDNFLSTHPFAPLAVPTLADAINIYHTNPTLYYVPEQPGLTMYNSVFGGGVSLVEERPDGRKWKQAGFFGNADKIVGTPDLVENILKNNKHKVDEPWALRTRLLDFLIGDWDRHDDQWTWAAIEQKDDTKLYRPIPRDRDQAFSKYDGVVAGIGSRTVPFLRQLQVYGPTIKDYKWNTWSARLFDRTFLNELTWPQWKEQIKYVQVHLTDSIIAHAFDRWPARARELSAPHIIASIIARRNDLEDIMRKHYLFVNRSVDVIGTDEPERIEVERLSDSTTRVTVYELNKNGNVKKQNYQRVFENNITKSINVYGNGGKDEFVVFGEVDNSVKVRLIGGMGKDIFNDSSVVKHGAKKTWVYDDLDKNTVHGGVETKDKRTRIYQYNVYDRKGSQSEYDITMVLPVAGFNPDDGLMLGAGINKIKYGFKKEPYASVQRINGSYAFATHAFRMRYTGDFISTFKKLDFYFDARLNGPTYAFNYAGIGNETRRAKDDDSANYYRVRQSAIRLYPAIKKRFGGTSGFITLGPTLEVSDVQATGGRYITSAVPGIDSTIFNTKYFSGAKLMVNFDNADNMMAPRNGIRFNAAYAWTVNLEDRHRSFSSLDIQFSFYKSFDRNENIVLASQLGTGINYGYGSEFFQLNTIGGQQGLRGYRTERFYGKTSFWHNTDVRARLTSSYNKTLPFTFGLFGSFDHGRVWVRNDASHIWHFSYGGGIWLAPVDLLTFSLGAYIPKEKYEEQPRVVLKAGFAF